MTGFIRGGVGVVDSDGIIHLSLTPILHGEGSLCREEVTFSPNIASLIVNIRVPINIICHRLHTLCSAFLIPFHSLPVTGCGSRSQLSIVS